MSTTTRPVAGEAAEYYFTYIDQVGEGDIRQILRTQSGPTLALLNGISEEQSLSRYDPAKWSIREVLGHLNDTERLFVFRAMWFARGQELALPSFDQDSASAVMRADDRSWSSHVLEFEAVRAATTAFFDHLPEEAWSRTGIASGFSFSVRALAYIAAGHVAHHAKILRERYGVGGSGLSEEESVRQAY